MGCRAQEVRDLQRHLGVVLQPVSGVQGHYQGDICWGPDHLLLKVEVSGRQYQLTLWEVPHPQDPDQLGSRHLQRIGASMPDRLYRVVKKMLDEADRIINFPDRE